MVFNFHDLFYCGPEKTEAKPFFQLFDTCIFFLCCLEFDIFLFLFVPLSPTSILPSPFFPSLISLVVSVDLRYHVYLLTLFLYFGPGGFFSEYFFFISVMERKKKKEAPPPHPSPSPYPPPTPPPPKKRGTPACDNVFLQAVCNVVSSFREANL